MGIFDFIKKSPPKNDSAAVRSSNSLVANPIIPRAQHGISRKLIHKGALKILHTLTAEGFSAYLVGGCVRDILLGRAPKDFDIVTDADPEQIRKLFKHCYIVGRRFRIVHVRIGRDLFEVSTFRATHAEAHASDEGLILHDNVYGTLEQDVWRRDFTVNALYYNITDFTVVDYTQAMADLDQRVLRVIGSPEQRFREDPARMLRAVRLAAKLEFSIEPQAEKLLTELRDLLLQVSPARLSLEVEKLFISGHALCGYRLLFKYGMFEFLFPQFVAVRTKDNQVEIDLFIEKMLTNTDERIAVGKYVTPAFFLAVVLWYPLQHTYQEIQAQKKYPKLRALEMAGDQLLAKQQQRLTISKRIAVRMREIWALQRPLELRSKHRVLRLLRNPRFRAAYDFLLLRAEVDKNLLACATWWTSLQEATTAEARQQMIDALELKSSKFNKAKVNKDVS